MGMYPTVPELGEIPKPSDLIRSEKIKIGNFNLEDSLMIL